MTLPDIQHLSDLQARGIVNVAMVPLSVLVFALEAWHFRGTRIQEWRDSLTNITLGMAAMAFEAVIYGAFATTVTSSVYEHRLATIPINGWTFALLFVLGDLCVYINHRLNHRVRLFWITHVVHHSSEHLNLSTGLRRSAFTMFIGASWITYLPLILIGFKPGWMLFALSLNLAYQFFLHTQWVPRLPAVIEYVFCTPSHHRAHHGRNARYLDKNYAGVFILFDRLFGTFAAECPQDPIEYGLLNPPQSNKLLWLNVHEIVCLWRDLKRPGPLWQRLKQLWMPPEWQRPISEPTEPRADTPMKRWGM
jgi:sterol desaturase/sphingolipid hydroxylase (fatty acid hydroxylase superfamily)